jgi:putative hydrolase of the HAD superfamily
LVQQQHEIPSGNIWYIADNPSKDFFAPRKLGWRTVRIRREGGLYAGITTTGDWAADFELRDMSGLQDLLQSTM